MEHLNTSVYFSHISFIIYLYFYELVFLRKAFSMQAGGVAGAFEYSCVCWREVSASATNNLYSPVTNTTTLQLLLLLYYSATTTSTITTIHITSATKQPRSSVWSLRRIAS